MGLFIFTKVNKVFCILQESRFKMPQSETKKSIQAESKTGSKDTNRSNIRGNSSSKPNIPRPDIKPVATTVKEPKK